MRPSNKQRSRNKPGNNGNHNNNNNNQQRRPSMGNVINRVFESAGPDGKVRGTPQQIIDKYQALARDAQLAGDRVTAENYLQHAEHYSRLLGEAQRQQAENRFSQEREDGQRGEDGQPQTQPQPQPQRLDDGYDPQRRQPSMPAPVASGLTMIDPDDSFDLAGPIETPEDRRGRSHEPTPVVQHAPQPAPAEPGNGAEHPGSAAASGELGEPSGPPAKRSRPRRRSKPEGAAPEPVTQAE